MKKTVLVLVLLLAPLMWAQPLVITSTDALRDDDGILVPAQAMPFSELKRVQVQVKRISTENCGSSDIELDIFDSQIPGQTVLSAALTQSFPYPPNGESAEILFEKENIPFITTPLPTGNYRLQALVLCDEITVGSAGSVFAILPEPAQAIQIPELGFWSVLTIAAAFAVLLFGKPGATAKE